jgi:peptide chain release factor 2
MRFGGIFDYAEKKERLQEVELELNEPEIWNDPEKAQALGKERSALENVVATIDGMVQGLLILKTYWKWR